MPKKMAVKKKPRTRRKKPSIPRATRDFMKLLARFKTFLDSSLTPREKKWLLSKATTGHKPRGLRKKLQEFLSSLTPAEQRAWEGMRKPLKPKG